MIKKSLSLALCCLLFVAANSSLVSAQTNSGSNASSIEKIKADVAKSSVSEGRVVVVKKVDGTKLKGRFTQKDDYSFTLTDSETGQGTVIAYGDVAQVKTHHKGDKIALIIAASSGAVVAIVLGSLLFRRCRNEGGC